MSVRKMSSQERRTYSVTEVARILGIGRNTAYELVRSNTIRSIRIGRRIIIPANAFEEFLGS